VKKELSLAVTNINLLEADSRCDEPGGEDVAIAMDHTTATFVANRTSRKPSLSSSWLEGSWTTRIKGTKICPSVSRRSGVSGEVRSFVSGYLSGKGRGRYKF